MKIDANKNDVEDDSNERIPTFISFEENLRLNTQRDWILEERSPRWISTIEVYGIH